MQVTYQSREEVIYKKTLHLYYYKAAKTHMESDGDTKQSKNHKSDGFFQLLKKFLVFDLYRYKWL